MLDRHALPLALLLSSMPVTALAAPDQATGYGLQASGSEPSPGSAPAPATPAPAPATPAPVPTPTPTPTPTSPSPSPLSPPASPIPPPVSNETACVIGPEFAMYSEHSGSTTIAVCDALRSRGAKVGPVVYAAAGFRSAYVVRLRPPGSSWSIAVTYEAPVGNPVKTRWISVNNFKEIPDAADALAKSLVDDDSTPNAEVQQIADFGGTIDGWIGGGSSSLVDNHADGGIALGATGLIQYKWLDVGVGFTVTTALFGESAALFSGLAGFRHDPVPWFRFDLLGEGGAESVRGAGGGMFSRTISESSATLPYVGGRASLSFLIGRSHRFLLGWWFNSGSTIGQKTVTATVETCFLGCSINTDTHTVGGPSFTTGLRIGGFIH